MDTGRFTSSTSEYPEWFLTAFAVAEPEIFALASTQAPPGTASLEALPTNFNNNEFSEKKNDIIRPEIALSKQPSFLSINNLVDIYGSGRYIYICVCVFIYMYIGFANTDNLLTF